MGRVMLSMVTLSALALVAPAGATTVAIVKGAVSSPITAEAQVRLQGELSSVGFETVVVTVSGALLSDRDSEANFALESTRVLDSVRSNEHIDAAVSVSGEPTPGRVTVWAIDRAKGRSLTRKASLEAGIERSAATLAIRALELLRSCFFELDLAFPGAAPRAPQPPPVPVAEAKAPPPAAASGRAAGRRFGVELGSTVAVGVGGAGPSLVPLLRVDWAASPDWTMTLEGSGLGTRPIVQSTAGSADVGRQSLLLAVSRRFWPSGRLRPLLALAAGALRSTVDGTAVAPNQGRSAARWSLLLEGSAGADFSLGERFFLVGAARIQLAEPYVAVRLVNEDAATLDRPELLLALSLGAWL